MRITTAVVLTLISSCRPEPSSGPDASSFSFRGELVHPGAIQLLVGILADPMPVVSAVDLEGWSRSEEWEPAQPLGPVTVEWKSEGQTFEYRIVGRTPQGTFVLKTSESSETGSGVFENLVFVRLERVNYADADGPRVQTLVRAVGGVFIGDREYPEVSMKGSRVVLRRSDSPWATLKTPVEFAVE